MRLKAIILCFALTIALFSLSACGGGKRLDIIGSPASRAGVTVTLEKHPRSEKRTRTAMNIRSAALSRTLRMKVL